MKLNMNFMAALLVISFSIVGFLDKSFAEEEAEINSAWGIVDSVSSNQIVINEYNSSSEEYIDVTYDIDPEVIVTNVDKIEGINSGDSVEIEFEMKEGKKIIKTISVDLVAEEE